MNHLFIPYEIAKQLKEKGFNEECMAFYAGNPLDVNYKWKLNITSNNWHTHKNNTTAIIAPFYQQVMDWFMNKHQIFIDILTDCTTYPKFAFDINRFIGNPNDLTEREWDWKNIKVKEWHLYRTHKEAMDYAIKEALKLI